MSTDWRRIRPSSWHPWSLAGLFAPVALAFVGFSVRGVVSIVAGSILFGMLWLLVPVAVVVFWVAVVRRGARVQQRGMLLLDRLDRLESAGSPRAWAVLDTVELRDALAEVPPDEPTRPGALRELPPPILGLAARGRALTIWELRADEPVSVGIIEGRSISGVDARGIRTGARTRRGIVLTVRSDTAGPRATTRTLAIVPVQRQGGWFQAADDDSFADLLAAVEEVVTES